MADAARSSEPRAAPRRRETEGCVSAAPFSGRGVPAAETRLLRASSLPDFPQPGGGRGGCGATLAPRVHRGQSADPSFSLWRGHKPPQRRTKPPRKGTPGGGRAAAGRRCPGNADAVRSVTRHVLTFPPGRRCPCSRGGGGRPRPAPRGRRRRRFLPQAPSAAPAVVTALHLVAQTSLQPASSAPSARTCPRLQDANLSRAPPAAGPRLRLPRLRPAPPAPSHR